MPVQYPLIASTVCQRLAIGLYIVCFISSVLGVPFDLAIISIFSLCVFALGLFCSMAHLGKKGRFLNSFANPKSHLTREAFLAPFVAVFLFLQGINFFYPFFGAEMMMLLGALATIASFMFVWSTGLAYQLFARPAWKTRLVSLNFMLSTLSLGCVAAYTWAVLAGVGSESALLIAALISTILLVVSQSFYAYKNANLGYGVAINPFDEEFASVFVGWIIFGVALPGIAFITLFAAGKSVLMAICLLATSIAGIAIWRAYFFLAGKDIKFFPMYERDLDVKF